MGGEIAKSTTIGQKWHRHVCEISLGVGLVVLGLFAFQVVTTLGGQRGFGIEVPLFSITAAVIGIAASVVTFFRTTPTIQFVTMFISYAAVSAAVAILILDSGTTASPYVLLWMVMAAISGVVSGFVTLFLLIGSNGYLITLLMSSTPPTQNELLVFFITNDLPLILAFALWYNKRHKESPKERSFTALANELSQVANKSEIVINAIADGVVAIDEKGIIQLINPAAQTIVGWGKQDALRLDYRSVLKLVDSDNKPLLETIDPIQVCLRTNQTAVTEQFALLTTSNKRVMVSLHVSPVGELGTGAIIVFRDITTQIAEERRKGEFISTASHEMRTPVAAIEGYLGLALNPATATIDDKARTYIEKAHESAKHLGRLFQDLLDISKAEDGRLKNDPRVVDIVSAMRDITQALQPKAVEKHLTLIFAPDASSGSSSQQRITPIFYAYIDIDHLREVASNLIENAVKYTKEGSVTVDVVGDNEHVSIKVTDTGIGIPAEDIPHLFQKFYRVDSTDTREIGGTGLGLYLSRRLIESVGGRLGITSEIGKGSTFSIEINRMAQEEAMRYIEQHSAPATPAAAPQETPKT